MAVKNMSKGGLGVPDICKFVNVLKLIWIGTFKTSNYKWKQNIAAAVYPEMQLFRQLSCAVPYVENHNTYWSNVFQAYDQR